MNQIFNQVSLPCFQLVWGLLIGCSNLPSVNLEEAVFSASLAKAENFAGVMTWSVQKDTNHRTEDNSCNDSQTGEVDGSFLLAISRALNE